MSKALSHCEIKQINNLIAYWTHLYLWGMDMVFHVIEEFKEKEKYS